ncbi:NTP transferase domain-containing protein [bacterium]|nr:NTP transferase domain-containing protein [bacterium]
MNNSDVQAVILAAGKGTRMESDLPKVLHQINSKPMLGHVLEMVRSVGLSRSFVVVGHKAELVSKFSDADDVTSVLQEPQLGTGHAVQVTVPVLKAGGYTIILCGDVPLLKSETVSTLIEKTKSAGVSASVLTCVVENAGSYGRIVKDADGNFKAIVEARDATAEQIAIGEYNSGVFCFKTDDMIEALAELKSDNDQSEYYLTDTIAYLVGEGRNVQAVAIDDPVQVMGINTVAELAEAEKYFLERS